MKLRFAPSPTGFLHVGGARTAIFNLLHARRLGGRMLLRIEDTDVERSKQHHAEQIVSSLQWLGIEWDEGPVYQSDRLARYRERAEELVAERQGLSLLLHGRGAGGRAARPRSRAATRTATPAAAVRAPKRAIRSQPRRRTSSAAKCTPGPIEFHDLIRGDVQFEGELIDDFVLLRSDGNPTYHLSVVVDDIDMAITHVARGDDHLSNTPKHIAALSRLRRRGAGLRASAAHPRQRPQAPLQTHRRHVRRGVSRHGHRPRCALQLPHAPRLVPGGDREIFTPHDAAQLFDLADVNKAPAVFDPEKLLWMNGQYLMRMSRRRDLPAPPPVPRRRTARSLDELRDVIELNKTRARTLRELAELMVPFFADDDAIEYDPDAVKKHLKGDDLAGRLTRAARRARRDRALRRHHHRADPLRSLAETRGLCAGKLIHPLRLALTGRGARRRSSTWRSCSGRNGRCGRLQRLIARLPELAGATAS